MDNARIAQLAAELAGGRISLDNFLQELAKPRTADLGDVQLDLDRRQRCGYPEVVFGEGKSVATIAKIFRRLLAAETDVLGTRIAAEPAAELSREFPTGRYNPVARTFTIPAAGRGKVAASPGATGSASVHSKTLLAKPPTEALAEPVAPGANVAPKPHGIVVVVTAGTTDLPVAEEAAETARWMGAEVTVVADIGVAGPHRLLGHLEAIRRADAVVVVAGMEGALPSMVGGYVAAPIVAVPTSVGYGANFGGMAALLSMLNSCAANVTVVNIDAGFKAGYVAGLIAQRAAVGRG
jgi:NCAIR mutase (PurE)-related protein